MPETKTHYQQLFEEWKIIHNSELGGRFGEDNAKWADAFRFGVWHALVLELRKVSAFDADKAVAELQEGVFGLSEEEWKIVSTYVLSQTYLAEEWEH